MWFDTHCHLQKFYDRGELERVLSRSQECGISKMVTVGTSSDDWDLYATYRSNFLRIYFTV